LDDTRNLRDVEQEFDTWAEAGPWLLLLVLPLAALSFRRGWLLSICFMFFISPHQQAYALGWKDLWSNKNQQGVQAFVTDEFDEAANLFEDGNWRAASFYRNGDYQSALNELNAQSGLNATYNKANTLAQLKRYADAIDAYDEVLAEQPDHTDALFNKAIVQNLLEEQEKMQPEDQEENEQGQEQEQDESEQSQSEQQQNQEQAQQSEQDQENSEQPPEQQEESEVTDSDAGQEQENEEEQEGPDPETAQTQESAEEEQAMQQWLGRIEDDPGELLRNKFRYQTQQLLYEQLQNPGTLGTGATDQIW